MGEKFNDNELNNSSEKLNLFAENQFPCSTPLQKNQHVIIRK